jgi:hypothetical protein
MTRFNLIPQKLHRGYDLQEDVPNYLRQCLSESVIFYLAIRQHIGLMECLPELPWRALIYEGHEGETIEELDEYLALLLRQGSRIVLRTYIADGFCARRPLALLLRT